MPYPRPKPPAGGIKANYPGFIEPSLATSIDKVPAGERWIHEIKFYGHRVQVHLRDAAVKVFTRRGNDWTNRFRKIAADAWNINAGSEIIDGAVVVPAEDGTADFSVLQNELKGRSKKIVMVAFDLLYLNGYDLRKLPLFERKVLLKKIVSKTDIQFSESFEIDGREMYKHACKTGLEGVVSKVRDSRYVSGRVNDWVKKTCAQRETLTIAGFALDGKKWDGIYLGRRKGKELIYAGKVGHGFDSASAKDLQARLKPLIRERSPTPRKSRTVASGSSRRYWQRSNTGRSQPRARCAILSSRASGRIYELARGLDVGDRHRLRPPRCARRSLLFVRMNDEAHSQICTSVRKTRTWTGSVCASKPWSTTGNRRPRSLTDFIITIKTHSQLLSKDRFFV